MLISCPNPHSYTEFILNIFQLSMLFSTVQLQVQFFFSQFHDPILAHSRMTIIQQSTLQKILVRITSAHFQSACHWKRSLHSQRHVLEQKTTMHLYITRKIEAGAPLFLLNKTYFEEGKQFFQCTTQPPSSKLTEMRVDPHLVARIISHLTGRGTTNETGCLLSSGTVACSTRAPQQTILSPLLFTSYMFDFKCSFA